MYHHGTGGGCATLFTDAALSTIVKPLLASGYIVVSSDGHQENWGKQASIDDHNDLYDYLVNHYSISKVMVLGHSMGGLSSLLSVANGHIPVTAWAGIFPITNLANLYGAGTYTTAINTAYNIPAGGTYAVQTAGHDPNLLTASAFNNIPMRFYASSGDTTVSKTNNSDAMSTKMSGTSPEYTVVACSGNHGDPSHFQPSDIIAFYDRYL